MDFTNLQKCGHFVYSLKSIAGGPQENFEKAKLCKENFVDFDFLLWTWYLI